MMYRLVVVFLFLLDPVQSYGQKLSETLSRVGEVYARAYLTPLTDVLGADVNTGLFHTAKISDLPYDIDIYLGIKALGTLIEGSSRAFDLSYQSVVEIDYRIGSRLVPLPIPATLTVKDAPTFFGDEQTAVATVTARHDTVVSLQGINYPVSIDTSFSVPTIGGLVELNIAPLPITHFSVGSVFGTGLTLRWLPQINVLDAYGALEIFGIGLKHSLSQHFAKSPIDIAMQVFWHQLRAEDASDNGLVTASMLAANLIGSKQLEWITVYGGIQVEKSSLDVSYTYNPTVTDGDDTDIGPTHISFGVDSKSKTRGVLGIAFHLGPIHLNTDFSVGQVTTLSAGLGLSISN